jgi:hypothetical protein
MAILEIFGNSISTLRNLIKEKVQLQKAVFLYFIKSGSGIIFLTMLSIVFIVAAWPIGPLTLISALICYLTGKRKGVVFKVSTEFFFSVTIGLAILSVLLIVFDIAQGGISDEKIRSIEYAFINFYSDVKSIEHHLTIVVTIIIIAALLAIDYYLKSAHALSRFLLAKKILSRIIVILLTITSFTFFSPSIPNKIINDYQDGMVKQYRALLRQEKEEVAKYIAAEMLTKDISNMTPVAKNYYHALFKTIDEKSGPLADEVAQSAAAENFESDKPEALVNNIASTDKIVNQDPLIDETLPASKQQRDYQRELIATKQIQVNKAKSLTDKAVEGLKEVFLEVLKHDSPELGEIAGKYLEEIVSQTGELIFNKAESRFNTEENIKKIEMSSERIISELSKLPLLSQTKSSNKEYTDLEMNNKVIDIVQERKTEAEATTEKINEEKEKINEGHDVRPEF